MDDEVMKLLKNLQGTSTISFRVPLYVKALYDNMPMKGKALLKQIIAEIITSGKLNVSMEQRVINLNININHNEVKPEINVNNGEDLRHENEVLRKKMEGLQAENYALKMENKKLKAELDDIKSRALGEAAKILRERFKRLLDKYLVDLKSVLQTVEDGSLPEDIKTRMVANQIRALISETKKVYKEVVPVA